MSEELIAQTMNKLWIIALRTANWKSLLFEFFFSTSFFFFFFLLLEKTTRPCWSREKDKEMVSAGRVSSQHRYLWSPRPAEHRPVVDDFPQHRNLSYPASRPTSQDHPHSPLKHFSHLGRWSLWQLSAGKVYFLLWTSCQFIAGLHIKASIHTGICGQFTSHWWLFEVKRSQQTVGGFSNYFQDATPFGQIERRRRRRLCSLSFIREK